MRMAAFEQSALIFLEECEKNEDVERDEDLKAREIMRHMVDYIIMDAFNTASNPVLSRGTVIYKSRGSFGANAIFKFIM